ncbi:hypothetical protein [Terrabacter sp. NPDC080008]|uniref:GerMN domain-containing protein n=1 Tax=Terrabacter sp. NPDC080008 TaxID=3155176 RepID=UPI00344E4C1D
MRLGVALAVVGPLLAGCTLSAQSEPERVVVSTAAQGGAASGASNESGVPLSMQVYLVRGNRLERVTRVVPPGTGLEPALRALAAPVSAGELAAGLRTALPATSRSLGGTMGDPHTADVAVPVGYDRLSLGEQQLAMAQIVFTVTADTLADRVRLVSGSRPVAVPVAHGDLVTRPVSRQDYAVVGPTR